MKPPEWNFRRFSKSVFGYGWEISDKKQKAEMDSQIASQSGECSGIELRWNNVILTPFPSP